MPEPIEERGCELLDFLPNSPDLSPIDEAYSRFNALLREVAARTREAWLEVIGRALSVAVSLRANSECPGSAVEA